MRQRDTLVRLHLIVMTQGEGERERAATGEKEGSNRGCAIERPSFERRKKTIRFRSSFSSQLFRSSLLRLLSRRRGESEERLLHARVG